MKTLLLLFIPTVALSCKAGFVPTDVPGICQEADVTDAVKPSDEKPPSDKMPSYQREGIFIVNCPSTADADARADREKADAEAEGKRKAGIR